MDWIVVCALLIALLAMGSLWGAYVTKVEFARGDCSYETLAGHTGVFDRKSLEELVGRADARGRYRLTAEELSTLPRGWLGRYHLDEICIVGAMVSVLLELYSFPTMAAVLVCTCGSYQLASWGYAFVQIALYGGDVLRER